MSASASLSDARVYRPLIKPAVEYSRFSVVQGFTTGGKFNDAEVTIHCFFSTALASKQKAGGKFYVRKLARGKRKKKVENPWHS